MNSRTITTHSVPSFGLRPKFPAVLALFLWILGLWSLPGLTWAQEPPRPAAANQPRSFPDHWGPPPRVQTRDYRPLPGGYGFGSSTLAGWIQQNMDRDVAAAGTGVARVSGEPKQWHAVTLDFEGPETDEKAEPNPFTDYRLDVVFTHYASGDQRVVPGFFAADGQAAQTSATSGNVWRVRFSPSQEGEWSWEVSFRTGPDVAMADSRETGTPWEPLHGRTGTLRIGPSDKRVPDLRARGHLEYVGERYLRFAGDGSRFLKGGVDSPETLLGYADFDGTYRDVSRTNPPPSPNSIIQLPSLDQGLLRFKPHEQDWRPGDPTWKDGKGRGLIGGINYLSSQGVNSVYFLTMNVNGDGMNVWPWVSPWVRDRFDVSKLDQWEIVFQHMTHKGIALHIVTQETENDHLLDRGFLGRERKLYYRELVARFSHHPAITWNLGEENVQSVPQQLACAGWLRHLLPYRQHIVIHNDHWHAKNLRETFDPLIGKAMTDVVPALPAPGVSWPGNRVPLFTGPAIQDFHWPDIFTHVAHYVETSARLGFPWVVTGDELGGANFGTLPDAEDPGHDNPRRFGLWATLMAGGAGVEWYFGWQNNSPHSDLSCEDWRTREGMYRQTRVALDFFHQELPFWRMQPFHPYIIGHGVSGLAVRGEIYAIYQPHGGGTRFLLGNDPGLYEVKWFNPRTGGDLVDGPVRRVRGPGLAWTGFPPNEPSKDWLTVVRRIEDPAPVSQTFPGDTWEEMDSLELGVHPNGLHHALNYWRMFSGPDGVDKVVLVRRGCVLYQGRAAADPIPEWPWESFDQGAQFVQRIQGQTDSRGQPRSALDVARVGWLHINEGRWQDSQVLPESVVKQSIQIPDMTPSDADKSLPTGLLKTPDRSSNEWIWWPNTSNKPLLPDAPPGTRVALGKGHNLCVLVPEWDMVVVRLGSDDIPEHGVLTLLNAFLRRLGMAVAPLE